MPSGDPANQQFLAGFMDDYFAECDEHLSTVRRILLQSESADGISRPAVEELFRAVHSIKGLSGMVELNEAEFVAHHLENYLRVLRAQSARLDEEGVGALIEGTHALEQVIAARRDGGPAPPTDRTIARLAQLVGTADSRSVASAPQHPGLDAGDAIEQWVAVFTPSTDLAAEGITVDRVRALLRQTGEIVNAAPKIQPDGSVRFEFVMNGGFGRIDHQKFRASGIVVVALGEGAAPVRDDASVPRPAASASTLAPSHYVRVDLGRLDDLMRMIGDLVIGRARLAESLAQIERDVTATHWRAIQENSLTIERQLRDLREGVMRVRLVPIGEVFRRMPFVVRDLAKDLDKQVELELRGEHTEIDKFLVERLLDPLVHLVRNAISHGIESPDGRARAGKPAAGRITLTASSVGDRVVLEVGDDGAGVDVERVLSRAQSLGLAIPQDRDNLDAVLALLCAPGFSTRDAADRASGRGVGMSVVQTTIEELGGQLSLDTAPGQGTRFIIELPVTLAITDAIIVEVGGQLFAIPQGVVREIVEIDATTVRAVEKSEIAPYRGGVLPLVRLAGVFGLPSSRERQRLYTFVIGHGTAALGLVADRVVGQREIVVRPLTDPLVKVDGVVGATDLGDGRVVLILDAARFSGRSIAGSRA